MKKTLLIITSALFTSILFSQVPGYVPSNGLVGYWPFNGNAIDESGTGNNGTINGATLTPDRFGSIDKALSFNNNYVLIPANSSLDNPQGTIAFWMKTNSTNLMIPIKKNNYSGAGNEHYSFALNYTNLFSIKYNSVCQPGIGWFASGGNNTILTDNNWHLVVATYSTQNKVYIDGILVESVVAPNSNSDVCSGDLQFGREWSSNPNYFNGLLDDIGIWNRVLSETEIQTLYESCQLNISTQPSNQTATTSQGSCQFNVSASGSSVSYIWQTNIGLGFQNLSNAGQYSGVGTNSLTVSNLSITNNNQQFRCVIADGGCNDTSEIVTLTIVDDLGILEIQETYQIAPNPTMDIVNIKSTEAIYDEYVLFDPQGRKVLSGRLTGTTTQVDLSQLARGNYLLQIGEKKTPIKLIKQ
jgi:hypothetical protein